MSNSPDRYTHGHHESVLRSHRWRTADNSAAFVLAHLTPGLSVLDVGCGPGTITMDFARLVSPGKVIGVDRSAEVIEQARTSSAEADLSNLTFDVGDVYELRFADHSFDVVYAHQVLQHLVRPVAALAEMRRVVRPGGVVAIRDADFGAFTWAPHDDILDRWNALYHEVARRNGAEPDAGRHLEQWCREAGFSETRVSSSTWNFSTPDERRWWGQLWADRVTQSDFATQCVEYGTSTRAELEAIRNAFLAWASTDEGFFLVESVEVLATP